MILGLDKGRDYVIAALTDNAKQDVSDVGSHVCDLNMKGLPKEPGIYYWEGHIIDLYGDIEYQGTFRKATSKDLIEAKLIEE